MICQRNDPATSRASVRELQQSTEAAKVEIHAPIILSPSCMKRLSTFEIPWKILKFHAPPRARDSEVVETIHAHRSAQRLGHSRTTFRSSGPHISPPLLLFGRPLPPNVGEEVQQVGREAVGRQRWRLAVSPTPIFPMWKPV